MPNGIIIIDKPAGWTSMDVCAKLRGILHEKRVGHAGTLDPMATGVLPVFVGQATKAVFFAENGRKVYEAVLQLGRVTDTQDTTGETLEEHAVTVTADDMRAALRRTEASGFRIGEAVTLEDAAREGEALLRPLDSLFRAYPAFTIPNAALEKKCLCGNPLRVSLADGIYRVYGCDGTFLALSEARDGLLTSKRNFFSV